MLQFEKARSTEILAPLQVGGPVQTICRLRPLKIFHRLVSGLVPDKSFTGRRRSKKAKVPVRDIVDKLVSSEVPGHGSTNAHTHTHTLSQLRRVHLLLCGFNWTEYQNVIIFTYFYFALYLTMTPSYMRSYNFTYTISDEKQTRNKHQGLTLCFCTKVAPYHTTSFFALLGGIM